jgi:hypothetical protein
MVIIHPVFVILPLGRPGHVRKVFDEGIAPALNYFGYEAKRVDNQAVRGGIVSSIQEHIVRSYFVIADLSFGRPNCYYELGYAHAIEKPTLLVKDEHTSVHFDLADQMVHSFKGSRPIKELIKSLVPKFLETQPRDPDDDRNGEFGRRCIRDGFRLTARIEECRSKLCVLTLEVSALDSRTALDGFVNFYMHHSYRKRVQKIKAKDGIARYEEVTSNDGPWTLGAKVVKTGTMLELDLTTIPGAKEWWYRKALPEL